MKIISQKIISQRKANQFNFCILIRSYTNPNQFTYEGILFPVQWQFNLISKTQFWKA